MSSPTPIPLSRVDLPIASPIEDLVQQDIAQHLQSHPSANIVLGYSGGTDSTALLLAAAKVCRELPQAPELIALHVHHGLQDQADNWAQACINTVRQSADLQPARCQVVRVTVDRHGNLENNARRARYAAFAAHSNSDDLLLMAHHSGDQSESILLRLVQGRGVMPMRRQGQYHHLRFARPLLGVARETLEAYVAAHQLVGLEDPSNRDVRFTRGFLRHRVLPVLRARWPGLDRQMARVAQHQVATQQALQHLMAQQPAWFALAALPQDDAGRLAWLRAYLQARGGFELSDRALSEWLRQLQVSGRGQLTLHASGYPQLRGYRGWGYYVAQPLQPRSSPLTLREGQSVDIAMGVLTLSSTRSALGSRTASPLVLRQNQPHERLAQPGGRQTAVHKLLARAYVPPWLRAVYPLVYLGDQLICVPGIATNATSSGGDELGLLEFDGPGPFARNVN